MIEPAHIEDGIITGGGDVESSDSDDDIST